MSKRLKNIQTFVDEDLITAYNVNYTYSSTTKGSIMSSIEQCDAQAVCFPPTTFDWVNDFSPGQMDENPAIRTLSGIADSYTVVSSMVLDANNDGFSDIAQVFYDQASKEFMQEDLMVVLLSDGSGNYTPVSNTGVTAYEAATAYDLNNIQAYFGGDVNGDGSDDVVQVYQGDNKTVAMVTYYDLDRGGLLLYDITTTDIPINDSSFFSGDVNGDGLMDIVQAKKENNQYTYITYLGKSNNKFAEGIQTTSGVKGDMVFFLADVNGDGNTDFIQTSSENGDVVIYSY